MGAVLEDVLTDADLATSAVFLNADSYVELGFVDNVVVNRGISDLAIYELGSRADPFEVSLTVGGITSVIASVYTGYDVDGKGVNVAMVDLSDFGLLPDETINNIVIGAVNDDRPLLAVVGAPLESLPAPTTHAPEPGPIALFLAGSVVVGMAIRRRILT